MKLYKIKMNGDFGDSDGRSMWASSKRQAQKLWHSVRADCLDGASQPDPEIIEVNFEPTRTGLLEMLNKHADRG